MHLRVGPASSRVGGVTRSAADGRPGRSHVHAATAAGPATIDVLRWPGVGRFLRWRHARTSVQLLLLAVAIVVVADGLLGPDFGPANAATTLTWIHYRGLLVVALLAAGNLFCLGCPMIRVRDWGRALRMPALRWPRLLRTKWIGLILFAAVLVAYEWFDLWTLPRATALLVLGYFGAALLIDLVFAGATFCKYLCPIGQFNFAASTTSPLEMRVREPGVCGRCETYDCIKGRPASAAVPQRGCELGLFLPAKVGNLDCTFCLDCAHACPHDNVALAPRAPGAELIDDRRRSGIGHLAARPDLAALAVLFAFGGLVNALAMTAPVQHLHHRLGWPEGVTLAMLFALALGVVPLALIGGAAGLTRGLTRAPRPPVARVAIRYAYALIPLGFAIWLAHYGFHFLTGALSIVPIVQRLANDVAGRVVLGTPGGAWTGLAPSAVLPIEFGVVLVGTCGSLAVALGIAQQSPGGRPVRTAAPWIALIVLIATAALGLYAQPMDMRGMEMAMRRP